jgi:hypothetical protein
MLRGDAAVAGSVGSFVCDVVVEVGVDLVDPTLGDRGGQIPRVEPTGPPAWPCAPASCGPRDGSRVTSDARLGLLGERLLSHLSALLGELVQPPARPPLDRRAVLPLRREQTELRETTQGLV